MGEAWSLKDPCTSGEVSPWRQDEDRQELRARELRCTWRTPTASERSRGCCSSSECFLWSVHSSKHTHHMDSRLEPIREAPDDMAVIQWSRAS